MPRKPRSQPSVPGRSYDPMASAVRIMPPPQREAMYAEQNAPPKRKSKKGLTDDEFETLVGRCIEEGVEYDEQQMQPGRLLAAQAYNGEMKNMPPNEGGSRVVSYDVRDTVNAAMPSFLRVFTSADSIVEFSGTNPQTEAFAELATVYITKLVRERLGVIGFYAAFKDAAMARVGAVTWYWDESERVETRKYTGLDDLAYELAVQKPDDQTDVEVVEATPYTEPVDPRVALAYRQAAEQLMMAGQQPPPPPQPRELMDCIVRYTSTRKVLRIEPVPPEERIMSPRARSIETSPYVGRRMRKRVHELVALGYDRDEVLDAAGADEVTDDLDEQERQPERIVAPSDGMPDDGSEDYREVEYCELWIRADRDGDGIAELLKVCTIGDVHRVVHEEPADQVCQAEFRLMPIPHSAAGESLALSVIDVQEQKTALRRGLMESLPHSIYPRWIGLEGKVNWDDLLSLNPGQPTRIKEIGALTAHVTPFAGAPILDVIADIDENVRDPRTGLSKFARGLDADALQSTPKEAAAATIGATQMQLEGYARMLAETGMRQLYKGLLREVVMNQNDPDWMKVNGEWVQVDPRTWSADLSIDIDPAPGTGDLTGKLTALTTTIGMQQAVLEKLGPQNPLVGLPNLYNALSKFVQLAGLGRNPNRYYTDPTGQQVQPPPGPPDPSAALAEAEVAKEKMRDATKRYQLQLEDDRERDKLEVETVLKSVELLGKFQVQIDPMVLIQAIRMPRPPGTLPAPPNPHNPDPPQGPPAGPGQGMPGTPA